MLNSCKSYLFWVALLSFFYFGLASYGLLNNNEGLYAQIAWEMVVSKNWVIPHLNGVPYIEKPPLLYWVIGILFQIFGKSLWAARLVPATFGLLTCYLVTRFENHQSQDIWPGFILMTFAGFAVFSRMIFFDVALTFFFTATMLCFWRFYQSPDSLWAYGASVCLSAAVLTKGLVALVLVGFVVLPFLYVEKNLSFIKQIFRLGPLLLFMGLTVPWHVLAQLQDSDFFSFYFINEHVYRFLDKRIPKDYYTGPLYYYIPRLLGYILPWTFVLPFLRKWSFKNKSYQRFLLCWFVGLLVFFSLSKAKANYYMVIGLPPFALYLGQILAQHKRRLWIGVFSLCTSFALICGGLYWASQHEDQITTKPSLAKINKHDPIFLYKRFEELSSLPFYVGRPIPVIQSESRDLWYGQKKSPDHFLNHIPSGTIYVLKRDQKDFLKALENKATLIYASKNYSVYDTSIT